jgi:WD40 repeat protein/serine/threonine protein kinase
MNNIAGQHIKGYELHERIGAGGFGAVYRAFQSTIGREVAMKIILPGHANHPDFIRRFEAEAHVIARLEHPYIVPLHDYWRDPDGAYLVMRYLRGGSLHDSLQKQGAFALEDVVTLMEQVTQALHVAHRNQVIHRDIKPGNILMDEDGNAYLADFGIAKDHTISQNITDPDGIIGSPDYLAPEQARSESVTPQTDIYSLGVVLYELLEGTHPFPAQSPIERLYKHLNQPLPDITLLDDKIREAVNEVIQKATAKNPQQRFKDVIMFAQALREAAALDSNSNTTNLVELLTPREQEVLKLLIEGKSNREIADALVIEVSTVKSYINQLYRKLNVRSRVQAIVKARELDLIVGKPQTQVLSSSSNLPEPENPYKGLRAFQAADAQDFFGREKLIQKLLKRLHDDTENHRFLVVVGPSGSGKSSVVKAGLIPALWRGELASSDNWYIVDMLPGNRPLDELEVALLRVADDRSLNLHEQLERDANGLLRVADLILPDAKSELLLVIDQFEEVFTLVEDENERLHFLKLLFAAVSSERSRVRVIVTLRADYYDRPLQYPDFGELIRNRVETILPLSADELEHAVREPANAVAVRFEDGLVSRIVADVHYQPGALPLLQYALTELFERRNGRMMTQAAYEAIGGTGGALANRADEIYLEQDEAGRELIRQIFLRLVTLGEGAEDARRRIPRSELLSIVAPPLYSSVRNEPALMERGLGGEVRVDAMDEIIDLYAASRLLSLDNDPATRTPTVEVAHEAILREWERLRAWLNESREDIRQQRIVAHAADGWKANRLDTSYLLSGTRLEQVEKWHNATELALTPLEREFIEASIAQRAAYLKAESERQARELRLEQRSRNFLRGLVAVFAVATLIAIAEAIFAFGESNRATIALEGEQEARVTAEANFHLSESQRLAAEANLLLQEEMIGEVAALLSVQAVNLSYSPQADMALQRASRQHYGHLLFTTQRDIFALTFSPDGASIVASLYDGTMQRRNAHTGDIIWQTGGYGGASPIAVSPDNQYVLVADGAVHLLDMQSGEELRQFANPASSKSWTAVFSSDGQSILVAGSEASWIADLQTGDIMQQFGSGAGSAVFSPDNRYVTTINDRDVQVWDVATGQELHKFEGHTLPINTLSYSPDGSYVATTSVDGTARLWNMQTGGQAQEFSFPESLFGVAFSPDGRFLATGSMNSTAQLWDIEMVGEVRHFTGHTKGIFAGIAFSPNGRYLLTGSRDASARLWDLELPTEVNVLVGTPGFSYGLIYSPDSSQIAAGFGHTIFIWDSATYELLHTLTVPGTLAVHGIRFSPDGGYLLAADMVGWTYLFNNDTGEIVHHWEVGAYNGSAVFTPDGHQVLTSTPDGMFFWDVESGEQMRQLTSEPGNSYLTYSPDGRYLFTAGPAFAGSEGYLWDVATGEKVQMFVGHSRDINSVAFSPDGQFIVTGSDDTTAIMWNVETGEQVKTFIGHTVRIWAVNFTRDGRYLLTGAMDNTARLWDIATGQELRRFVGGGFIGSAIFSPDERFVLIGSTDGKVYITPTHIDDLIASVCERVQRDLTSTERGQYIVRSDTPTCPKFASETSE